MDATRTKAWAAQLAQQMLDTVLRKGYYGRVEIRFHIEDGTLTRAEPSTLQSIKPPSDQLK